MNGIEKITRRIDEDAQKEINHILTQARGQAAEITARYEAQARKEAAEIAARGEKAAAEREKRLLSAAEMEEKKADLAAKQELLDQAFRLAVKRLAALPQKEYISLLAGLAAQAAPAGQGELLFSPEDRARVGEQVAAAANERLAHGKLTVSRQTVQTGGGFLFRDGRVEVNCTLEALVGRQRGRLSGEAARLLFA